MGMTGLSYAFDGTRDELEADFFKQRKAARIEYGTTYNSGSIAAVDSLRVIDLRFASITDAESHAFSIGKPNELIAARVSAPVVKFDETPEAEAARERLSVAAMAYHNACEAIVDRLRESAPALAGNALMDQCESCASTINMAVFCSRLFSLNDLRCPVCDESNFGLSANDRAILAPLEEAVALARRDMHAAESTFEETVDRIERWHVSGLVCI